jgi:hypothetical protein
MVPYQQAASNRSAGFSPNTLRQFTFPHFCKKKHSHMPGPIIDKVCLKFAGIHICVPCECCKVMLDRETETRCKEHMRHMPGPARRGPLWQSSDFKQSSVDCNSTSILDRATGYMDQLKESVEITLQPRNFKRDGDFNLNHLL